MLSVRVMRSSTRLFLRRPPSLRTPLLRQQHAIADVAPVVPSAEAAPVRSDWYYLGLAALAITAVVGPVAFINELQTDVELRELVDGQNEFILPRLREFFDIPHDEGDDSRAADRPRGCTPVDIVAFHASGKRTMHTAPAHMSATMLAGESPDDPIIELVAADAVLAAPLPRATQQYPGQGMTEAGQQRRLLTAILPGGSALDQPSAMGALQTRDTLLNDIARTAEGLDAVTRARARFEAVGERSLAIGVLGEEQERMERLLSGLRGQLETLSRGREAGKSPPATSSISDPPASLFFFTRGEEARVHDRLGKVRRLIPNAAPAQPLP